MAKPGRPASENYQPVCCSVSQSVSYSSTAGSEGLEDEDDKAPIFSLSKSSMDVVMATGPPHKRDPAWTRMDLKRSSRGVLMGTMSWPEDEMCLVPAMK